MAKKVYKIEHTHQVTDLYYIEADSLEQAEALFFKNYGEYEIEDVLESDDFGTVSVTETE